MNVVQELPSLSFSALSRGLLDDMSCDPAEDLSRDLTGGLSRDSAAGGELSRDLTGDLSRDSRGRNNGLQGSSRMNTYVLNLNFKGRI